MLKHFPSFIHLFQEKQCPPDRNHPHRTHLAFLILSDLMPFRNSRPLILTRSSLRARRCY